MLWTSTKPTKTGWYFYREPGKNMDKPVSVWVITTGKQLYVSMFVPQSPPGAFARGRSKIFPGHG